LKDYAIIHTESRRQVVRMTMRSLAQVLVPFGFVQVHKSLIVAGDKLALTHRNQIEFGGVVIPVGRRYRSGR
jgi:DNA-binding LytR/AlgR family response regulator